MTSQVASVVFVGFVEGLRSRVDRMFLHPPTKCMRHKTDLFRCTYSFLLQRERESVKSASFPVYGAFDFFLAAL